MATQNQNANLLITVYAVVLSIAGVALAFGTHLRGWGAGGYVGACVLTIAGVSMLVKKLQGGLTYLTVTCPACGVEQTWAEEALAEGRVVPCQQCLSYLERPAGGDVVPVAPDRVAPEPIFGAPHPAGGLQWSGCALCGASASDHETVEGTAREMGVAANKRIVRTIEVPVCTQHRGQQAVSLTGFGDLPGDRGFTLHFRSYAQCRAFRERNPTETKVRGNLSFGRA